MAISVVRLSDSAAALAFGPEEVIGTYVDFLAKHKLAGDGAVSPLRPELGFLDGVLQRRPERGMKNLLPHDITLVPSLLANRIMARAMF